MLTIRRLGNWPLLFRRIYKWKSENGWQNLKKEKKRKKLVQAAKELEAKADPSLPKKRLPKNGVVK